MLLPAALHCITCTVAGGQSAVLSSPHPHPLSVHITVIQIAMFRSTDQAEPGIVEVLFLGTQTHTPVPVEQYQKQSVDSLWLLSIY